MNFFTAQAQSNRTTRVLILLLILAVLSVAIAVALLLSVIVWLSGNVSFYPYSQWLLANFGFVAGTALVTIVAIVLASSYRIMTLRQGGARVARELGGTPVEPGDRDPSRQRLRNVVEEMAIAAGITVPDIFLLEHEAGINAFAAGFSPADAAVAVTRGALENLSRDELQGVVAHEFSHILNGDMRLNIRLMGPLFGILGVSLLGRALLRSGRFARLRSSRDRGLPVILALGAGLTAIGFIGVLLARLIKSAVSRQREYLADASAVQYTRQASGIAGALKKIGGLKDQSLIRDQDAEEISHMLFATGSRHFSRWFATHPPLLTRIQRLEPDFTAKAFSASDPALVMYSAQPEARPQGPVLAATSLRSNISGIAALLETVGNPDERHIQRAQQIHRSLPRNVEAALESSQSALLLLPALMLHPDTPTRDQQLGLIAQQLGAERRQRVETLYDAIAALPPGYRLPLLELTLPRLKQQPQARVGFFIEMLERLAAVNDSMEVFEYALIRLLQQYVEQLAEPQVQRHWRGLEHPAMQDAAASLIALLARVGHHEAATVKDAYACGMAALGLVPKGNAACPAAAANWVKVTDDALRHLRLATPAAQQTVIRGLLACALADGRLHPAEAELLQCVCALLNCPLPPIVSATTIEQ